MSPEDREAITRSIANLWTFNAVFISRLLGELEEDGRIDAATIERMLQGMDDDADAILEGDDDKLYAVGLLAAVRGRLQLRRDEQG